MSAYIYLNSKFDAEDVKRKLLSLPGVYTVNLFYSRTTNRYQVKINRGTAEKIGLETGVQFTLEQLEKLLKKSKNAY